MYTHKQSYFYTEYDIARDFHKIKQINIAAKLDIKTLQRIQRILDTPVPSLINEVKAFNCEVISVILIESIQNKTHISPKDIMTIFDFYKALELVLELLQNSMPTVDEKKQSLFEDEEEEGEDKLWDFDYMFHLWTNVIKRSDDMFNLTARTYFKQINLYKEMMEQQNGEKVQEV